MNITLDGKELKVSPFAKNLIDAAKENSMIIQGSCYKENYIYGCCHACVVEVNGSQNLACRVNPAHGMVVIYDREDLREKRKAELKKYAEKVARKKKDM